MKLHQLKLKNFRCFAELTIDFESLTCLLGRNDAGKSSVLDALAIFFNEASVEPSDATVNSDKIISISCEFTELPEKLILDSDHLTSLEAEFLLNERGFLEIQKVFNCDKAKPTATTQIRCVHPTASGVSDLLKLKNSELKQRALGLELDTKKINLSVNTDLRAAIRNHFPDLLKKVVEIGIDKQIEDKLHACLPVFALFRSDRASTDQDAEAQDPMKAAIKEAIREKEMELSKIADFINDKVSSIAEETIRKLQQIHPDLAKNLTPKFAPPSWSSAFKVSLLGDDDIPINKRGSGTRRLILLSFFRAKAERKELNNNIIYALEEPETSQHPDNQKRLLKALEEIIDESEVQIILTSHTPVLGRLLPSTSLRYIESSSPRRIHARDKAAFAYVKSSLGVLPDHNVKLFILLEGTNDINFFKRISAILHADDNSIVNLEDLEKQNEIIFIPTGGSNLELWSIRLNCFDRPEFHLYDRDSQPPAKAKYQVIVDEINQKANCRASLTGKRELENYLHIFAILTLYPNLNITVEDFNDVPELVAKEIHNSSGSKVNWDNLDQEKKERKISRVKRRLNDEGVSYMTPTLLAERDPNGEVRDWLSEIGHLLNLK